MKWSNTFAATIILDNELLPNFYNMSLEFNCNTDDVCLQNIGFERMRYFVNEMIHNSVIINKSHKSISPLMKQIKSSWILLPGDPNDQLVLWCLYHKIAATLGDHFTIEKMTLDSNQGDLIEHSYDGNSEGYPEINDPWVISDTLTVMPWWHRPDHALYDAVLSNGKKATNAIFTGFKTWEDLGLQWFTEDDLKKSSTSKSGKVIKPKKFQLKVVEGKNAD